MNDGYKVVRNFLNDDHIKELQRVLLNYHKNWCEKNQKLYRERAINSAYLTKKDDCPEEDRIFLFNLICSEKINNELVHIFNKNDACFLNTQLFFDPYNSEQKNYWHRDIQYTGLSLDEQKKSIADDSNNVVHFRIAIKDENGIELIPGTNKRWDSSIEYKTRMNSEGRKAYDNLPDAKTIALTKGDLLIFSANMIHRGLYGKDRFSFDILYCKPDPDILSYADLSCYPDLETIKTLKNPSVFERLYEFNSISIEK